MAAGEEMFPVAWHGYDSRQLSQLGPIGRFVAECDCRRVAKRERFKPWQATRRRDPPSLRRCWAWTDASASWRSRSRRAAKQTRPMQAVTTLIAAQLVDGARRLAGRQLDAAGRGRAVRASQRLVAEARSPARRAERTRVCVPASWRST